MRRLTLMLSLLVAFALVFASQAFVIESDVNASSESSNNFAHGNAPAGLSDFDSQTYYRLTTVWRGDGMSLDIVNDGQNNDQLQLSKTGKYTGQYWKITPAGNGYYRLSTEWRGEGMSLDVINDGQNNDRLILAVTTDASGQYWKITPAGKGAYRLTTSWQGEGKSLDIVNDGKNNNQLILAKTANVTGQHWKITAVKKAK
ncbi:MAG: RICIN domain-containing protein [Pyrinomonadaceae bacterium]|nr:RICIN domain-containing protein [Pyrinomonadaceae bacterium]